MEDSYWRWLGRGLSRPFRARINLSWVKSPLWECAISSGVLVFGLVMGVAYIGPWGTLVSAFTSSSNPWYL